MKSGRGTGKSTLMMQYGIDQARRVKHKVICGRALQKSMDTSMKPLIARQIVELGLANEFRVSDRYITHLVTDSLFEFHGLNINPGSLQSIDSATLGLIDEAQFVRAEGWRSLVPSLRRPGSRFIVSINPRFADDPVYDDLLSKPSEHITVIDINRQDNPYWTEALEIERVRALGSPLYEHIWEGKLLISGDAVVFQRGKGWDINGNVSIPSEAVSCHGADIGFTSSPSASIGCWYWNEGKIRRVHVEAERYGRGLDQDNLTEWLDSVYVGGAREARTDHQVLTSSAARRGDEWAVKHADKRPGSVDEGIRWLQSAYITIDPSCVNLIAEMALFRYAIDVSTDKVLAKLEPNQADHAIDAMRYALSRWMLKRRRRGKSSNDGKNRENFYVG